MIADACTEAGFLLRIIVKLVKYIHIIIPIILVVFISYDLFKVVVGQADDKEKKEATTKAVKRIIYAVIIFFIPMIINFTLRKVNDLTKDNNQTQATSTDATSWIDCWISEYNK